MGTPPSQIVWRIFMGIGSAYCFVRAILYMKSNGRLSIQDYWSRVAFRYVFALHLLIDCILPCNPTNNVQFTIYLLDENLYISSICLLAKSLQDFAKFSNQHIQWIDKVWLPSTITINVICFTLEVICIYIFVNKTGNVTQPYHTSMETINNLLIFGVAIQGLWFVIKIRDSLITPKLKKLSFSALLFFAIIATILIGVSIYTIIEDLQKITVTGFKGHDDAALWLLGICLYAMFLTQDGIDWMANWLIIDESDESEPNFDDVLSTPIVMNS